MVLRGLKAGVRAKACRIGLGKSAPLQEHSVSDQQNQLEWSPRTLLALTGLLKMMFSYHTYQPNSTCSHGGFEVAPGDAHLTSHSAVRPSWAPSCSKQMGACAHHQENDCQLVRDHVKYLAPSLSLGALSQGIICKEELHTHAKGKTSRVSEDGGRALSRLPAVWVQPEVQTLYPLNGPF